MKKTTLLMMFAAATGLASCNHAPQANLKSDVDTLSYMVGVANNQGLMEFVLNQGDVDSAHVANFIKGLEQGLKEMEPKEKAYLLGLQLGQQVSGQMYEMNNRRMFGNDTTVSLSKENYLAGFIATAKKEGTVSIDSANVYIRKHQADIREKAIEKEYAEYKKENEEFLAQNKGKEGVQTTESGLQYKVITKGTGEMPADTSNVKVMYKGTLIDGTEFDKSEKPITLNLQRVIKGWTEALSMMPVGSKWELYIPQELAYGSQQQRNIKPFSTLIFEVELVEIEK